MSAGKLKQPGPAGEAALTACHSPAYNTTAQPTRTTTPTTPAPWASATSSTTSGGWRPR